MSRGQRRLRLLPATFLTVAIVAIGAPSAAAALPDTQNPTWQLDRTIRTTPFAGSSVSMRDNEGSAYVPSDDSLWLADDNAKAVYEIEYELNHRPSWAAPGRSR